MRDEQFLTNGQTPQRVLGGLETTTNPGGTCENHSAVDLDLRHDTPRLQIEGNGQRWGVVRTKLLVHGHELGDVLALGTELVLELAISFA